MIGGILDTVFLSGGIGDALNSLAQAGFFTYALPFLLIFALVFGILTRMGLFKENKGVTAIIAIAVGLMALSVPTIPQYFSQIFPSLGVGLSILLVVLILVGFFSDPDKPWVTVSLFIIAAIVALVVIVSSAGPDVGFWIQNNLGNTAGIIAILIIVAITIIVIVAATAKRENREKLTFNPMWAKELPHSH